MSTCYYLDCKKHEMAVHFTDNKASPPNDKELLRTFLMCHGYQSCYQCEVHLESEHTIEWDHIKNFEKWIERNRARIRKKEN